MCFCFMYSSFLLALAVSTTNAVVTFESCGQSTHTTAHSWLHETLASAGEADSIVSVQILRGKSGFAHRCGGSLVQYGVVALAAHCLVVPKRGKREVLPLRQVRVQLGSLTLGSGFNFSVESIVIHPDFNMSYLTALNDDIALLFLDTRTNPLPRNATAVCLTDVKAEQTPFFGSAFVNCLAFGWGSYGPNHWSNPAELMYRRPPLHSPAACAAAWGEWFEKDQMLCAGEHWDPSPCAGDLEGPLYCIMSNRQHLMGIVSFGSQICLAKSAVFTKVASYYDWIGSQIKAKRLKWPLTRAPTSGQPTKTSTPRSTYTRRTPRPTPQYDVNECTLASLRTKQIDKSQFNLRDFALVKGYRIFGHRLGKCYKRASIRSCMVFCLGHGAECRGTYYDRMTKTCELLTASVCDLHRDKGSTEKTMNVNDWYLYLQNATCN